MNFSDIVVSELDENEKNLIRYFRIMGGQHGIIYSKNEIEFTDGVATTTVGSEDNFLIDILSKMVQWNDDPLIDYFRKRKSVYR